MRKTVLLADANEEFRKLLRETIGETNEFTVVADVGTGTEALKLMEQYHPDLLLMDVVLPEVDGLSILKQSRAKEDGPKVILISAQ